MNQPIYMSPDAARWSEPPGDFASDGCTCFPDRLLTLRGWVHLRLLCRMHDWHYHLLRTVGELYWTRLEREEFKKWADASFKMRLIYRLESKMSHRSALLVARGMWAAVTVFGRGAV